MSSAVLREAQSALASHMFTMLMFVVLMVVASLLFLSVRDREDVVDKQTWNTVVHVLSGCGTAIMLIVFVMLVFRDKPAAQRALEKSARMRALTRNAMTPTLGTPVEQIISGSPVDRFVTASK